MDSVDGKRLRQVTMVKLREELEHVPIVAEMTTETVVPSVMVRVNTAPKRKIKFVETVAGESKEEKEDSNAVTCVQETAHPERGKEKFL